MFKHPLAGIYAAALTPLNLDLTPDLANVPVLLDFLAQRGCHGALISGTTGEGPSFSPAERLAIWQAATEVRQTWPDFRLFAGTGTPSLDETITLNKTAYDLGFDAVVTLPPFYFRNAGEEGLFSWFSQVMDASVPSGCQLLAYHFPAVSGVDMSMAFFERLRDHYPDKFGGLKDSTGSMEHAQALNQHLSDRLILVGSDRLLSASLADGGSGCITALANLISSDLRKVWDAFQGGGRDDDAQGRIDAARAVMEDYQPYAPSLKALIAMIHGFPQWAVKPPLLPLEPDKTAAAARALQDIPIPLYI